MDYITFIGTVVGGSSILVGIFYQK